MDGIHDMGGMDGFGKVEPEPDEPVFHADWEGRVLAMNRAMGAVGVWNIDIARYGIERLPPDVYLTSSYYRKWFLRLEMLLVEHGLVGDDEIAAGRALHAGKALARNYTLADARRGQQRGAFGRPAQAAARFKPGDRVRARNIHPKTHTRLPRYVRGHVGVVERLHGAHVFPDSVVLGQGEDPQWLYTVCFDARDLWGADADPTVKVSVEAFEPYLEPA
ncbi:nitrile hydratase subunit beta [Methylovirgula sp. 4M-Z18]|uniref:nitrile hydratase subunit beta n=1 Tax=Methylovirgula sp. 4M-Z18 TaxID=2293567 RepID=UPI000E2FECB6|nr:nitrile hydratase subunit beta [Methylovirgula sp. 4M-Z18]RFB79425.1 nitrile hydratase subunit beta [Methylovirgula sp. 4M-Z18]